MKYSLQIYTKYSELQHYNTTFFKTMSYGRSRVRMIESRWKLFYRVIGFAGSRLNLAVR